MMSRISRALDSIWRTADLEDGDPHEDEAGWFRDRWGLRGGIDDDKDEELMTLVPGWEEARRQGWKPLGGGTGPMAYRGSGDRFEFIAPKFVTPDDDHWNTISKRWIRYSQGEGGMKDPYVRHAETFKDAIDDRKLHSWNLYKNDYNPETQEFDRVRNENYPFAGHSGVKLYSDAFDDYNGGPGFFDRVRQRAEDNERRLNGGH